MLMDLSDIEWGDVLMAASIGCGTFIAIYWFIYPRRKIRGQMPGVMCCGSCGYPTHGLETVECPECGANFLEVGVFPSEGHGHGLDKPSLLYSAVISLGLFFFLVAICH